MLFVLHMKSLPSPPLEGPAAARPVQRLPSIRPAGRNRMSGAADAAGEDSTLAGSGAVPGRGQARDAEIDRGAGRRAAATTVPFGERLPVLEPRRWLSGVGGPQAGGPTGNAFPHDDRRCGDGVSSWPRRKRGAWGVPGQRAVGTGGGNGPVAAAVLALETSAPTAGARQRKTAVSTTAGARQQTSPGTETSAASSSASCSGDEG